MAHLRVDWNWLWAGATRRHGGRSRAGWRLVALLAVLALVLVACPADDPDDDVAIDEPDDVPADLEPSDETFRVAVGVDLDTLDPAGITTTTVDNMIAYTVETLTVIDEEGETQPNLATDWDISEDGLTYTIQLQEGVQFHDGTPFDADAVVFTFERLLDEEVQVPIRAPFEPIESITAVDDHTVEFQLSEPFPPLISALSFGVSAIISPESVEEHGNTYTEYVHPIGTGPYTFADYAEGERFRVERFDDYWGELPYYGEVVFSIVPESATRVSAVRAGDVDMIILPPVSDIPALEDDPDVEVLMAPGNRTIFIAINNLLVDDPLVRQAFNYAVDKEAIIDSVLFGAAEIVDAPMDESLWGYCPGGDPYPYDPDRARELLEEAGATDLSVDMIAPTGRYIQDSEVAEAIAGFLTDVGVDVSGPDTMDWPSYVETITTPVDETDIELHLLGWAPSYMDSFQHMLIFQSDQHPPAGLATAGYDNPEMDEILAQAATEPDEDARQDLYCQASELAWEDAPWIYLYSQSFPIVYRSDITNVSFRPNESFYAVYAHPADQ
jgi:ABC-type transport system substrate-binding protein